MFSPSRIARKLSYYYRLFLLTLVWKSARYHVISFPKSGRTWVRFFLASYIKRLTGVSLSMEFKDFILPHLLVPRVYFSHSGYHGEIIGKVRGGRRIAGGETPLSVLSEDIPSLFRKHIIFIARDPRDVAISYYFQLTKRDAKTGKSAVSLDVPISSFIRDEAHGIRHIIDYMNLWYSSAEKFRSFLMLRYEDLRVDPYRGFTSFLQSLELPVVESVLEGAIEDADFSRMQELEREGGLGKRIAPTDASDPESYKVRRGKVGGYVDYLSPGDLAYANAEMKRLYPIFGYR